MERHAIVYLNVGSFNVPGEHDSDVDMTVK